jgi:polar amino acid transport system substrate-binding protein
MVRSRPAALTLALVVSAAAIFVAGCGSSDSTTGESGGGEKLTVGSDVPYPPFEEFGQTKDEFKGFDVEMMEAIGEKIGREPEFTDTSFDTIFVQLAQGKFEAVASATTITEEREETVSFTEPYYQAEQAILVQTGGTIDSVAGRKGATVGAQKGTTGAEFVEEKAEAGELRTYPQGPDAVNAVKSGVVEAVVMDIPVAENAVKSTTGIEVSSPIPTEEEYGFAVGKNDEALLEELNEGLAEIKEDGTYEEIYEKYFHRAPSNELLEVKGGEGA